MPENIAARLSERGITIPEPPPSGAHHVPYAVGDPNLFTSGQQPIVDGERRYIGKVGRELSLEDGYQAARVCALNMIGQVRLACDGDLDRVVRCIRINGLVNSAPEFLQQPEVIHGASELIAEVFGDSGLHSRVASGTNVLPFDVAVICDGVWEIRR
ncbi:MAG: RidA family protein [Halofilum sp. (in: g-proteobacteria)]